MSLHACYFSSMISLRFLIFFARFLIISKYICAPVAGRRGRRRRLRRPRKSLLSRTAMVTAGSSSSMEKVQLQAQQHWQAARQCFRSSPASATAFAPGLRPLSN